MEISGGPKRVAIACQGGGSHTAFTAGVLKRLLGPEELAGVEVVGLSGTSGGAVCALLAWYALLDDDPARAGKLLEEGRLARDGKYKQIMVRLIELSRPCLSRSLGTASKLNRDPAFIRDLVTHGQARAEEFLAALAFGDAWRRRDPGAVLRCFAGDAELSSVPPFPDRGTCRGTAEIGRFVREHLTADVQVDPTRKLVARDRVTWNVRAFRDDPANRVQGRAEAQFRAGRITAFRLGA
jgi:hypothetical protein